MERFTLPTNESAEENRWLTKRFKVAAGCIAAATSAFAVLRAIDPAGLRFAAMTWIGDLANCPKSESEAVIVWTTERKIDAVGIIDAVSSRRMPLTTEPAGVSDAVMPRPVLREIAPLNAIVAAKKSARSLSVVTEPANDTAAASARTAIFATLPTGLKVADIR